MSVQTATLTDELRAEIERRLTETGNDGYAVLLDNWDSFGQVDLLEMAAICAAMWKTNSDGWHKATLHLRIKQ